MADPGRADPGRADPGRADPGRADPEDALREVGASVSEEFSRNRRVMGFEDWFALMLREPARQLRSAAQVLRDAMDHFGVSELRRPTGAARRFGVFDAPFEEPARRRRLIGQEDAQARFYRVLGGFVREGRANKLVLLHGPNGSAKSTFLDCLARALEHYSTLDEGALYRFNWIFPSERHTRGGIGFSGTVRGGEVAGSYATLPGEMVDARLHCELKDHPAFLIPPARRRDVIGDALRAAGESDFVLSDYLREGDLCHKCKEIYEALLATCHGDYARVLRHVQVERFYLSRRYRHGLVTVEPQMSVDATLRQVTADRSLSALPPALQALSLFEVGGDLVMANRGMIDYADLLKRPMEAYKYLLTTVEDGRVGVDRAILFLDAVFVGTCNEIYLDEFKRTAEFISFKGRMELVRVPYLCDYREEERIYADQIGPRPVGKHVTPHAFEAAALWAVLTRMRKPDPKRHGRPLAEVIAKLSPLAKARAYTLGEVPEDLPGEIASAMRAAIPDLYRELDGANYEGRTGASPREIKTVLLRAAQSREFPCLSPRAVFAELEDLCGQAGVYEFLKREPEPGGYHEALKFVDTVREHVLDACDDEVRSSLGLVEESAHAELLRRYAHHAQHWVRGEKVRNPVTGNHQDPDEELMGRVEEALGASARRKEFRHEWISRIGAWSLDHPGRTPDVTEIFPQHLERLREHYFERARKAVQRAQRETLAFLGGEVEQMDGEARARATAVVANLKERGYCEACAKETLAWLMKERYG